MSTATGGNSCPSKIQSDGSFEDTDFIRVKWTKVTVSGPSGTGKSSALRLLLNESPITNHHSTSVVRKLETTLLSEGSQNTWEKVPNLEQVLKNDTSDDLHFIYAVDTGGQAAFLDIAPALLRYNSVNIVTHKLDELLQDETSFYYSIQGRRVGDPIKRQLTNLQVLESSIRSLASLKDPEQLEGIKVILKTNASGSIEGGEIDGKPSIIILGTFNDKIHPRESLDFKNKKLAETLSGFVMDATILKYSDGSLIFPVNAIARGEEEVKIADAIRREVRKVYIHAEIPQKWFLFQMELNKLTSGVATKKECDEIGQKLDMSPRSVSSALSYFHNLTILLYFPKILPHIIFLDPQPLFDKLSELISVSFAEGADIFDQILKIDLPNEAHHDLKNKGIFKEELLHTDGFMATVYKAEDFLILLENLQIIIKVPNTPITKMPVYFLPCVLPTANSLDQIRSKYKQNIDPLVLRWEGRIIPQGLYCALVLRLLQENIVDINGFLGRGIKYRNAIEMPCSQELGGIDNFLLLIDSVTQLEVYYSGDVQNCYGIREAIFEQLGRASRAFHYNSRLSNPELCLWDEDSKQYVKVDEEGKVYPSRQQPWLKSREGSKYRRHWEPIQSVDEALIFLKERDFNMHLWPQLGEELELTKEDLDNIEDNFDLSSRCLRECLSLWLEKDKGSKERIWRTLTNIAKKINLSKLEKESDDIIPSVDEAMQFLSDHDFNIQLWAYLGEELKLDDDLFDEIEDKFDSSSSCLRECLRLWLEEGKGLPMKTWKNLTNSMEAVISM